VFSYTRIMAQNHRLDLKKSYFSLLAINQI